VAGSPGHTEGNRPDAKVIPVDRIVIVGGLLAASLIVPGAGIAWATSATETVGGSRPAVTPAPADHWILSDPIPSREKIRAQRIAAKKAAEAAYRAQQAKFTPAYSKAYAKRFMVHHYGWGAGEYSALVQLWNLESGWDHHSDNPSSDAYGIPQALPGSKMASAGEDWRDDPRVQIRWGLRYIESTYGSPSAALAFHQSNNWY
jgi:hypothetical protein